jgi:uncharacterized protein (TIGR03086 family)
MDLRERYARAMAEFDHRVREIPLDRWDDPTPCEDWRIRDLVSHVVTEQRWVPELLAGRSVEEMAHCFEGDQLGDDPEDAWAVAASRAREAIDAADALDRSVQTSRGELAGAEYVGELTLDLAVHAWDLARATGTPERMDEELVHELLDEVVARRDELARSDRFGDPVPVQPSADEQTRLLALTGRSR